MNSFLIKTEFSRFNKAVFETFKIVEKKLSFI